jgi:flagellar FliL protein
VAKDKAKEGADADVESADGEGAPAKKKLSPKMLIIAGVAAVLVLGGGGGRRLLPAEAEAR